MALHPNSHTAADAMPDYQAGVAELAALRAEMARLAARTTTLLADHGAPMTGNVTQSAHQARDKAGRKARDAEVRIEHVVAANPYMALGLAAGLGLLRGAISRR